MTIALSTAKPGSRGERSIMVYCMPPVIEQAKKAVCCLQTRQRERGVLPNKEPHVKDSPILKRAEKAYKESLIYGGLRELSARERASRCAIRGSYTTHQHLRMLKHCLEQPISNRSPYIREHMALAVRHMMLLRNEDLANLKISSMFIDYVRRLKGGHQKVVMLSFGIERGKTNKGGEMQYACAIRNVEVRRCPLGAMAIYLFDLYHVGSTILL